MLLSLAYLILISLAEIIGVLVSQPGGAVFQALILLGLIVHATLNRNNPTGKMLLALTLAPMTRISSYSVPLIVMAPLASYVAIYAPIALTAFMVAWRLGLKPRDLGLTLSSIRWQLAIASTGLVFGLMEYSVLRYPPLVPNLTWTNAWLPAFTLLITTGFVEELVFRGLMQRASYEALGKWTLLYVSYIFAIVHVIHQSLLDIVLVFFIALFFAWCVKRTGSLLGVVLGHGITNSVLFLVAPFVFEAFGV